VSPRLGGRAIAVLAAKVALSVGLMAVLIARIPLASVAESLRAARPEWLAAAFGLLLLSNLVGAYQWSQLLVAVGIRIPLWKVCAYYHVGLFFNNFLPANIGGDLARIADASRHGETRAAALSTVLLDRMIGTLALASLALVTTLPAIDAFHLRVVYLALVAFFVLSVMLLWVVFHPALLPALERILARVGLGGWKPQLDDLAHRLQGFRGQRALFLKLLSVALAVQVARILVHALVARALGLKIELAYFFLFVPLLAVVVSLPISFNGIGVREGAGVVLFGLVGVSRAPAFSLQFTTYLVSVAVSLLGGVVFLARLPGRRAAARSMAESS
jgi:glycosyltransferase 2 family protein